QRQLQVYAFGPSMLSSTGLVASAWNPQLLRNKRCPTMTGSSTNLLRAVRSIGSPPTSAPRTTPHCLNYWHHAAQLGHQPRAPRPRRPMLSCSESKLQAVLETIQST